MSNRDLIFDTPPKASSPVRVYTGPEIEWTRPARGRNAAVSPNAAASVTPITRDGKPAISLTIYPALMHRARILAGDRILVGDTGQFIAIKRVSDGGFRLSAHCATKEQRQAASEKVVTASVKVPGDFGTGKVTAKITDVQVFDDGLVLIPKSPRAH